MQASIFVLRSINLCCTLLFKLRSISFENRLNGNRNVKEYKNITSVIPGCNVLIVHEPRNDLNIKGPFVILMAVAFGLLNVTYSVTIPKPFLATQYALTPFPAVIAPFIKSAFFKKVSQVSRLL